MTSTIATELLANEGAWNEVLLVVGPLVAIAGLLLLAKRRVDARAADEHVDPDIADSSNAG